MIALASLPNVDQATLAYLERVSGKTGEAAVRAWLRFTGWRESGTRRGPFQISESERLSKARQAATRWWNEHGRHMRKRARGSAAR